MFHLLQYFQLHQRRLGSQGYLKYDLYQQRLYYQYYQ